jgi:hypothetical protein
VGSGIQTHTQHIQTPTPKHTAHSHTSTPFLLTHPYIYQHAHTRTYIPCHRRPRRWRGGGGCRGRAVVVVVMVVVGILVVVGVGRSVSQSVSQSDDGSKKQQGMLGRKLSWWFGQVRRWFKRCTWVGACSQQYASSAPPPPPSRPRTHPHSIHLHPPTLHTIHPQTYHQGGGGG